MCATHTSPESHGTAPKFVFGQDYQYLRYNSLERIPKQPEMLLTAACYSAVTR